MAKFQTIRFMQNANVSSGGEALPRGVRRRYEIMRNEGSKSDPEQSHGPHLICDIEKSLLRGITRFHHDGLNIVFLSASNGDGTAWELEDTHSKRLGEVTARDTLKSCWQITSQGRTFEIYKQTDVGSDILRSTLGCWPDAYACVEGTSEIGAIRREERCQMLGNERAHERGRRGRPSFLGRLKKTMVMHDWVFSHTTDVTPEEELLLISGMLAIIEVSVPTQRPSQGPAQNTD